MSTTRIYVDKDVFELHRGMMDATSMHRPDVGRVIVDKAGHAHPWCVLSRINVPCFADGIYVCQRCGRTETKFTGPCTMVVLCNGERESCGGWYMSATAAKTYDPLVHYTVPSLVWVKDGGVYYDGDDEPHEVGHQECRLCGERIAPPYMADTDQVFVPGLMHCYINGVEVGREEFERRFEASKVREAAAKAKRRK